MEDLRREGLGVVCVAEEGEWQMEEEHGPWRWVKSIRMGTARASTPVAVCGEKLERQAKQGNWDTFRLSCSLAADLFTRGGLCLTPLLGKSPAHYWPIMDPVTVNQEDKNMELHVHMTLLPGVCCRESCEDASNRYMYMCANTQVATNTWQSAARTSLAQLSGHLEPVWK